MRTGSLLFSAAAALLFVFGCKSGPKPDEAPTQDTRPAPNQGRVDDSAEQADPVGQRDEGSGMDAFGWIHLGRTRELKGDLAGAARAFGKAVELDPESALASVSLARVLYRSGDAVSAAGVLSRVKDLGDPWVGVAMIDLMDSAGMSAQADEAALKILTIDPLPPECAAWLSGRALKKGDVEGAAAALSKAQPPEGRPGKSLSDAGFLLLDHGMVSAARAAFRDSIALEPLGRGRLGLAMALDSMRDWRAAAQEALAYCSANRDDMKGAVSAAAIMSRGAMTDKALQCLEAACALPGAGSVQFAALGRILRTLGRPAEAAAALYKARTLAPSDRRIAFEHATALAESGSMNEALAALELLASREDPEPHVRAYLAYLLAFARERLDEAAKLAAGAVAAQRDQGFYHAVLGFVKHRSGDRAGAEDAFSHAMACDPDPMALRLHGEYLFESGRRQEAVAQWKKAIELDPRLRQTLGKQIERDE